MCVVAVHAVAEVEDDAVAVGLVRGDVGGEDAGRLLGVALEDGDDRRVGDRQDLLAVDRVTLQVQLVAVVDPPLVVDLLPVHGHALDHPDPPVDRQGRAGVPGGVAAGVGGDVVAAPQRWPPDEHLLVLLYGGLAPRGGERAGAGGRGGRHVGDFVDELVRYRGTLGQRDVHEQQGRGAAGEVVGSGTAPVRLEPCTDRGFVQGLDDRAGSVEDLDLFRDQTAAGEAGHVQLVDQVGVVVGAFERDRGVLYGEQQRGDALGGGRRRTGGGGPSGRLGVVGRGVLAPGTPSQDHRECPHQRHHARYAGSHASDSTAGGHVDVIHVASSPRPWPEPYGLSPVIAFPTFTRNNAPGRAFCDMRPNTQKWLRGHAPSADIQRARHGCPGGHWARSSPWPPDVDTSVGAHAGEGAHLQLRVFLLVPFAGDERPRARAQEANRDGDQSRILQAAWAPGPCS